VTTSTTNSKLDVRNERAGLAALNKESGSKTLLTTSAVFFIGTLKHGGCC